MSGRRRLGDAAQEAWPGEEGFRGRDRAFGWWHRFLRSLPVFMSHYDVPRAADGYVGGGAPRLDGRLLGRLRAPTRRPRAAGSITACGHRLWVRCKIAASAYREEACVVGGRDLPAGAVRYRRERVEAAPVVPAVFPISLRAGVCPLHVRLQACSVPSCPRSRVRGRRVPPPWHIRP